MAPDNPCLSARTAHTSVAVNRAPGLGTLLDLHGETLFIDDIGHWVKSVVLRTDVTMERPLVLSSSLTLYAPDGTKLVGFDNADPVRERRDPGMRRRGDADHWRRMLADWSTRSSCDVCPTDSSC